MAAATANPILKPMEKAGTGFYLAGTVLVVMILIFLYAWYTQLTSGLGVTGMRDLGVMGGSPWGLYIATFIWWVGIAHGGIAVSASIRLMRLEVYRPVARLAEVITPITLLLAGLAIVLDLGRPDRVFNMLLYYGERVGSSPLIWDLTVIMIYLAFSLTYLVITMRPDLHATRDRVSRFIRPIYSFLLVGYHPKEKKKTEQMAWWLSFTLIVLMALLSGGVVPWLFGLMVARPGWFGAVVGPYFLTAALASAVAAVILVAAVVRRVFNWEHLMPPEIFRGLGKAAAILILVYLWFMIHEHITMQYSASIYEKRVSDSLLFGEFAPLFWFVVGGLVISFIYFAAQGVKASLFSLGASSGFSVLLLLVFWVKRVLIVVPPLYYTQMPYDVGAYTPTWVEWSLVVGTMAMAALGILLFLKFFPAMELDIAPKKKETGKEVSE